MSKASTWFRVLLVMESEIKFTVLLISIITVGTPVFSYFLVYHFEIALRRTTINPNYGGRSEMYVQRPLGDFFVSLPYCCSLYFSEALVQRKMIPKNSADFPYPGKMMPGMTFTIEPVITQGMEDVVILEDGWTAVTLDGGRTAQFEHTILITPEGTEILTCEN